MSERSAAVEVPHGVRVDHFLAGEPLRALAALWVLLMHAGVFSLAISGSSGLWDQSFGHWPAVVIAGGGAGVQIFFVLSGYLIARPFVHALQARDPLPRLGRYLAARVLRIYPAFWLVVLAVTVIYGTRGVTAATMVPFLTLTHVGTTNPYVAQLGQAWTLPLEVAFYAVIPVAAAALALLGRRLHDLRVRRVAMMIIPLAVWVAAGLAGTVGHNTGHTIYAAIGFAPGVALAAFEPHAPHQLVTPTAGRLWLVLAALAGAALLLLSHYMFSLGQWAPLAAPVLSAGIVGGLLMAQRATGRCPRLLDNRALRWLGVRSYGIYIIHYLVITSCLGWALEPNAEKETMLRLTFAALVITIAAADLSWRWIEQPALSLRTRINVRGISGAIQLSGTRIVARAGRRWRAATGDRE